MRRGASACPRRPPGADVDRLTTAQLALAAIGLVVWGWGTRSGDSRVGWAGIVMIAVASLLRFARRRGPPPPGVAEVGRIRRLDKA